jgi:hypothetical protein
MRTIKFKVNQQRIYNLDSVAFVYSGTHNYLNLEFMFGPDWDGCNKVISFGAEKTLKVMKLENNCCLVPQEAFDKDMLSFYLLGGRQDGYRIRTEQFEIDLKG